MGDLERDATAGSDAPERESRSSGRFLERPLGIVSLIAGVIGIITGIVTLVLMFDGGDEDQSQDANDDQAEEIQEFDGVAGHLAESRAIVNFLEQHDREVVYLDVGFPPILGPTSGDNLIVVDVPTADGNSSSDIQEVNLMTECEAGAGAADNPTVADGCQGVALRIEQPQNPDAQTFFEHGVPRVKGYFRVDVTGGLQMGLSPIVLEPLTLEEANAG